MNILTKLRRKKQDQVLETWEFEPFAFQPGVPYILELSSEDMGSFEDIRALKDWIFANGLNIHLVFTRTGNAIHPVKVRRMTQEVKQAR
jgi:hypothetical protein